MIRTRRIRFAFSGAALAIPLLMAGPCAAQVIGKGGDDGISLWRVAAAFVFCCLLAGCAALLLKRKYGGAALLHLTSSPGRKLYLVESLRLSHQIDLCLVRCDGEDFVVAASAQGATLLSKRVATENGR
jgi:hypothetical protein